MRHPCDGVGDARLPAVTLVRGAEGRAKGAARAEQWLELLAERALPRRDLIHCLEDDRALRGATRVGGCFVQGQSVPLIRHLGDLYAESGQS